VVERSANKEIYEAYIHVIHHGPGNTGDGPTLPIDNRRPSAAHMSQEAHKRSNMRHRQAGKRGEISREIVDNRDAEEVYSQATIDRISRNPMGSVTRPGGRRGLAGGDPLITHSGADQKFATVKKAVIEDGTAVEVEERVPVLQKVDKIRGSLGTRARRLGTAHHRARTGQEEYVTAPDAMSRGEHAEWARRQRDQDWSDEMARQRGDIARTLRFKRRASVTHGELFTEGTTFGPAPFGAASAFEHESRPRPLTASRAPSPSPDADGEFHAPGYHPKHVLKRLREEAREEAEGRRGQILSAAMAAGLAAASAPTPRGMINLNKLEGAHWEKVRNWEPPEPWGELGGRKEGHGRIVPEPGAPINAMEIESQRGMGRHHGGGPRFEGAYGDPITNAADKARWEAYKKTWRGRAEIAGGWLSGAADWAFKRGEHRRLDQWGDMLDKMTWMQRAGSSLAMRSIRFAGPAGLLALAYFSQNNAMLPAIAQFVLRSISVKGMPLNRDYVRAIGTITRDEMSVERQRERDMGEDPLILAYTSGFSPPDSYYTSQESVDRIRVQLGARDTDFVGTREALVVPGAA